jgi:hypothetical protein
MSEPLFQSILYHHPINSRKGLSWKVEEREKVGRGGRGGGEEGEDEGGELPPKLPEMDIPRPCSHDVLRVLLSFWQK